MNIVKRYILRLLAAFLLMPTEKEVTQLLLHYICDIKQSWKEDHSRPCHLSWDGTVWSGAYGLL